MIDPLSSGAKVGILFIYPNYFRAFLIKTPSFLIEIPIIIKKQGCFHLKSGELFTLKDIQSIIERKTIGVSSAFLHSFCYGLFRIKGLSSRLLPAAWD